MKKTQKITIAIVLLSIVFNIGLVLAQETTLEQEYPSFTDRVEAPSSSKVYLPNYIKYIYYAVMISGGIIILLVLLIGGFKFIVSAGNPAAITDAREQILSGFLGLVIILGAYVILNEINPDLVALRIPIINSVIRGIMLYNMDNCAGLDNTAAGAPGVQDIPQEVHFKLMNSSGSADINPQKNTTILPRSFFSYQDTKEDKLTIEFYNNDNCQGTPHTWQLEANRCYNLEENGADLNIGCVKFIWRTPGVWLFNKLDPETDKPAIPSKLPLGWAEGVDYVVTRISRDVPNGFADNIRSIAIVADKEYEINYGVVIHNLPGAINSTEKGWSHIYLPTENIKGSGDKNKCRRIDDEIYTCGAFDKGIYSPSKGSSITVFKLPNNSPSLSDISLYRQASYDPFMVNNENKDANYIFTPNTRLIPGNPSWGKDVGYIKVLEGEKWKDNGNEMTNDKKQVLEITNEPKDSNGVSSIRIGDGSRYFVLLYRGYFKDSNVIDQINALSKGNDAQSTIINQDTPWLGTVQFDEKVGTIVILRYGD